MSVRDVRLARDSTKQAVGNRRADALNIQICEKDVFSFEIILRKAGIDTMLKRFTVGGGDTMQSDK